MPLYHFRFLEKCAPLLRQCGPRREIAVAQTTLLVLAVAFDLRLDISQSVSSNKINLPSEAVLYMIELVLSRKRSWVSTRNPASDLTVLVWWTVLWQMEDVVCLLRAWELA